MSEDKTFQAGPLRVRISGGQVRQRQQKAPKERLSVDRIVDVALDQMREHGYDAVSMRSIARALDTGPASLYAHVASREQLDQYVVDRIVNTITFQEPDPERWDQQIKDLLLALLAAYRQHPGSARATMGMVPTELGALRSAEAMMAYCLAGGIKPQLAAWFCDLVALYVGAVAVEESIWQERYKTAGPEDWETIGQELHALFKTLPSDEFPIISSMPDVMTAGDGDTRLNFALDVLLLGLKALSDRA
jgi:AcrR family transcriptional regulator